MFLRSLEKGHSKGEYRGTCFILSHIRCPLIKKSLWSRARAQPTIPVQGHARVTLVTNQLLCVFLSWTCRVAERERKTWGGVNYALRVTHRDTNPREEALLT